MRLWHKDLISVLPKQQLLGQWRECCCIASLIDTDGTPNHLLVNKVMDYPLSHFYRYSMMIARELEKRGYKVNRDTLRHHLIGHHAMNENVPKDSLYFDWHNSRYLAQCFFNLQEKYDCGGFSEDEWQAIERRFIEVLCQD